MYQYSKPIEHNFSSNVFGKMDLSPLKNYIGTHLDSINSYPEPEPYTLEKLLADKLDVSDNSICVTNGATEAIYLIAQYFNNSHTAILAPTFSEYADACHIHNHHITYIFTLDELDCNTSQDIRMLWLCNPNNPNGNIIEKERLIQSIESHPNIIFVLDQSYEYFTTHEMLTPTIASTFDNVLQLHSMTKRFAIPGLRLGYVIGNTKLISALRSIRMPWSVNSIAIEAGMFLLKHENQIKIDIQAYLQEAQWLRSELNKLKGIEALPTKTHFMLVKVISGHAADLKEYLANKHYILIRDASNFEGLDEKYFRIATQTHEENIILLKAIQQWLETL